MRGWKTDGLFAKYVSNLGEKRIVVLFHLTLKARDVLKVLVIKHPQIGKINFTELR